MPETQLWLPNGNVRTPVFIQKILYCQADNQYTKIYFLDENLKIVKSQMVTIGLGKIEKKIQSRQFFHTDRSNIINLDYAKEFHTKGKAYLILYYVEKEFTLSEKAKKKLLKRTHI